MLRQARARRPSTARTDRSDGPQLDIETEYQIRHLVDPPRRLLSNHGAASHRQRPMHSLHPEDFLLRDDHSPCHDLFMQVTTPRLFSRVEFSLV